MLSLELPALQVAGAVVALGAWWALGHTTTADFQSVAVKAYAISSVVALPVTLGLPYLIPNSYRGASGQEIRGRGPWSPYVSLTVASGLIAYGCGLAGLVILASRPSAGLAVVVATCFAAGFVALSILGAQTARVMNQRGLMIMSSLGQALLPLTWLLAGWLGASAHVANELLAAGAALGCGLLVWHERRRLVSPVAAIRSAEGRTIRSALLLIPHLVLFAAFTQGMRLQAVGHASPERVAAAHDVMLIITIGATLAGSIHAFMTVKIQAAPDGLVDERVRVNAFVYGAMAVVCAVGTVVAMAWLAPHAMSNFPDLGPASVAALALVLPSILTYYALSGLAMRDSRAVVLLVTSATTVAAYYVTASIWPTTSAADASIEYGLSSLVLPLVLFSILMATARGRARGRIVRLSRACAVGYVPALALGVVAWVR